MYLFIKINKNDLSKYNNYSLSQETVDRIFDEIPRKFKSKKKGRFLLFLFFFFFFFILLNFMIFSIKLFIYFYFSFLIRNGI
jgi:hypothetical protein